MLKRIKNPLFIAALASFLYQVLIAFGVNVEIGLFHQLIDLLSYAFIGAGIYTGFDKDGNSGE